MAVSPETPPARGGYALVVDDHPLVSRGITAFIRSHPMLEDAIGVGSPREALQLLVDRGPPVVALVDFWMADGASTGFLQDLRSLAPKVRILTMSGDGHPTVRQSAMGYGAHGFLHKQEPPEVFAAAVSAVLGGGTWFGSEAHAPDWSREVPVTPASLGLTPRQGDILARMLEGHPNKQIARDLNLSEYTVKEHVTAVLQRLQVRSRVEAVTKLRGTRLQLNP